MTRNHSHDAHETPTPRIAKSRTQLREDADAILRDIAFVLKMTQKVRDEMHAETEMDELALVTA